MAIFQSKHTGQELENLLESDPFSNNLVLCRNLVNNINNYDHNEAYKWVSATYQDYSCRKLVLHDGSPCSVDDIKEFLTYMTGNSYLPIYNAQAPKVTYFLVTVGYSPDSYPGELYKIQYDDQGETLYAFRLCRISFVS